MEEISAKITPETYEILKKLREEKGVNMKFVIAKAVEEYVKKEA